MIDGRPTHLDLFSGIGGFALAARQAGFRTIGFCEIDKYCQRVLAKNFLAGAKELQRNGSGTDTKPCQRSVSEPRERGCTIHADIFKLDGTYYRGCDLLTGGFPCQPFSCAGKRKGKADNRHLWPEMLRVINEARPAWVLGENVAGIIGMELDSVLSDLEAHGYACRPFVIPACGVDARHRRNRVWIVGHAPGGRCEQCHSEPESANGALCTSEVIAHANGPRGSPGWDDCGMGREQESNANTRDNDARRWQPEPDVGRVAHGISARVDRLRGLGNAIVPQVAFQILKAIREQIENEKLQNPNPD